MRITINLRHLEKRDLHLTGEISGGDLELIDDELVRLREPVRYDLEVERLPRSVLAHGKLNFVLDCECARCLKRFRQPVELDHWACDLPLEGEDQVAVDNDCVDLTPFIREDILLAFPQHPLCETECSGLPIVPKDKQQSSGVSRTGEVSSAWSELNKLKFLK